MNSTTDRHKKDEVVMRRHSDTGAGELKKGMRRKISYIDTNIERRCIGK